MSHWREQWHTKADSGHHSDSVSDKPSLESREQRKIVFNLDWLIKL